MLPKIRKTPKHLGRYAVAEDKEAWEVQRSAAQKRLCQEFQRQQYFFGYRPC